MDYMIRKGEWLPRLEDFKRLAEQLSKEFTLKRSRRESINQLLALIAVRPIEEIIRIENEMSSYVSKNDAGRGYRNLAHFIVTGESPSQQNHSH